MKKIDTIQRATVLAALASAFFCFAASNGARADSVRFVAQEKSGEFAERSLDCEFVSCSREGIEFTYLTKGQKKSQNLTSDQVLALQFLDEPLELSTARVEFEVGNFEEALEKIDAIEPTELESARDFVRWEIAWLKASSRAKLALTGAAPVENADITAAITIAEKNRIPFFTDNLPPFEKRGHNAPQRCIKLQKSA